MDLVGLHESFAWVVVVSNGLAGLWVLVAHWQETVRSRYMWWAAGAAQATIAVQVVLGVIAQETSGQRATGLHMFYGFIAFATVGIMYSYRSQVPNYRFLLYGLGGLFLMGLALRSVFLL